jgi:BirA family biotin operon repressor/biotin-[acetyl-CoA-carboxylase] ligase
MKFRTIKLKTVDSTNDKAIKLIKKGNVKPTIITALKQIKGRGQYGKKWISLKGNLYMSIFFELKRKKTIKFLTNQNCQIVKKILLKFVNKIKIKYPNDLLIKKEKICGILQEIITYNNKKYIIIGIGVNIKKSPEIINYPTTHLAKHSSKRVNKLLIYNAIKKSYENFIK